MALVKVRPKFQVTLPTEVRERAGVGVGDLLEAKVERGKITLIPKSVIDRRLAEGLEDIRAGRVYGPYATVAQAQAAFRARGAKSAARRGRRPKLG
jgi:AbrB family looped-hinge helix DNA binding protein